MAADAVDPPPRTVQVTTEVTVRISDRAGLRDPVEAKATPEGEAFRVGMATLLEPAFRSFLAPGQRDEPLDVRASLSSRWHDQTADAAIDRTRHQRTFTMPTRAIVAHGCGDLAALHPDDARRLSGTTVFAADAATLLSDACPDLPLEPLFCANLDAYLIGAQVQVEADAGAPQPLGLEPLLAQCEASPAGREGIVDGATAAIQRLAMEDLPANRAAFGAAASQMTESLLRTQQDAAQALVSGLMPTSRPARTPPSRSSTTAARSTRCWMPPGLVSRPGCPPRPSPAGTPRP